MHACAYLHPQDVHAHVCTLDVTVQAKNINLDNHEGDILHTDTGWDHANMTFLQIVM